ncbi:hypothetical protein T492DRAFT_846741 [Pavlovales sp. CCMP2436]|nr:hypothetical protein T492DRAFT_846741 [Pavlovales sp. CCMP2436]
MLTKKSVLGTLALAACGLALCATLFSSAGPPLAFVGKAGWPSDGSEIVIETQAAKGKWSVCKPDPAWLIWDNSGTNDGFITTLKGWLKVSPARPLRACPARPL